eukprot:scaffold94115_cov39-Tisochrysis_lutea.AAC.3
MMWAERRARLVSNIATSGVGMWSCCHPDPTPTMVSLHGCDRLAHNHNVNVTSHKAHPPSIDQIPKEHSPARHAPKSPGARDLIASGRYPSP